MFRGAVYDEIVLWGTKNRVGGLLGGLLGGLIRGLFFQAFEQGRRGHWAIVGREISK